MSTALTFGSLTICSATTGFYKCVSNRPGRMNVKDISFPNVTGLRGRIIGVRNSLDAADTFVFRGISQDTSVANLYTLVSNCRAAQAAGTATLVYAQPKGAGTAQTVTNIRMVGFETIPPFVDPTYQAHSTKYVLSWQATFVRYE